LTTLVVTLLMQNVTNRYVLVGCLALLLISLIKLILPLLVSLSKNVRILIVTPDPLHPVTVMLMTVIMMMSSLKIPTYCTSLLYHPLCSVTYFPEAPFPVLCYYYIIVVIRVVLWYYCNELMARMMDKWLDG